MLKMLMNADGNVLCSENVCLKEINECRQASMFTAFPFGAGDTYLRNLKIHKKL